jgi:hypothetical protein
MSRRALFVALALVLLQLGWDAWEYDCTSRYLADLQAQVDVLHTTTSVLQKTVHVLVQP